MKNFQIALLNSGTLDIAEKENAILSTNDDAAKYGLSLTPDEAHELIMRNITELKSHGRVDVYKRQTHGCQIVGCLGVLR